MAKYPTPRRYGNKVCVICDDQFVRATPNQKACSPKCKRALRQNWKRGRPQEAQDRARVYQREWHRRRYSTDPAYREKELERSRERNRRLDRATERERLRKYLPSARARQREKHLVWRAVKALGILAGVNDAAR